MILMKNSNKGCSFGKKWVIYENVAVKVFA